MVKIATVSPYLLSSGEAGTKECEPRIGVILDQLVAPSFFDSTSSSSGSLKRERESEGRPENRTSGRSSSSVDSNRDSRNRNNSRNADDAPTGRLARNMPDDRRSRPKNQRNRPRNLTEDSRNLPEMELKPLG